MLFLKLTFLFLKHHVHTITAQNLNLAIKSYSHSISGQNITNIIKFSSAGRSFMEVARIWKKNLWSQNKNLFKIIQNMSLIFLCKTLLQKKSYKKVPTAYLSFLQDIQSERTSAPNARKTKFGAPRRNLNGSIRAVVKILAAFIHKPILRLRKPPPLVRKLHINS